jgi:hypothetical protein
VIAAVVLAAAAAAPVPPADSPAPELHALVQAARSVSVVQRGIPLEGVAEGVGNLTIEATRATAFPLVDSTRTPVGVFLQGKGRFRFRGADLTASESLRASKARNAWNLPLESDIVSGEFASALILFTGPMFGGFLDGPAAGGGAPAALDAERFRSSFREIDRLWLAWDQRVAENRLDATSGTFAVAWFDAPSPIAWTYDAARLFQEEFFYPFGRPESTLIKRPLAALPIHGGRGAQQPPFDVATMTVDVVQDDPNAGYAVSTFGLRVVRDGARLARFQLTSLDSIARANNGLPAPLREIIAVERVEDASGNPLVYWHEWSKLIVDLGGRRRAGDAVQITVRTRRKEPGGLIARRGKGAGGTVPPGEFIPFLDNGAPWRAIPIDVSARLDEPYRLAFAGMPDPGPAADGRRTFRVTAEIAPQAMWLGVVRDVLLLRGGTDTLPIALNYSPGTIPLHAERTIQRAQSWSTWLAQRLGPYPAPRLEIDAVGNLWTTAGTVSLSEIGLASPSACPISEDFASADLAGSIARRWLTARVEPADDRTRIFAGELADYLGDAAIDATDSPQGGSCLERRRDDWKMRIGRCRWSGPVEGAWDLYIAADSDCVVGRRAAYGLDLIRTRLGDDAFFGAIRRALETSNAAGRPIALDDVARESGQPALWDAVFRRFDATPVLVRDGLGDGAAKVGDPSPRTP